MNVLKNFLRKYHQFFLLAATAGILIDIFVIQSIDDLAILFLSLVLIATVTGGEPGENYSILGSLILLITAPFFLIIRFERQAEKMGVWVFMLFLMQTVQQLIELKRTSFKDVTKD